MDDIDEDDEFDTLIDWVLTYRNLLDKMTVIQRDKSIHLRLSVKKLLEYGDKHHYKISDREFLENILSENNELCSQHDKISSHITKMSKVDTRSLPEGKYP